MPVKENIPYGNIFDFNTKIMIFLKKYAYCKKGVQLGVRNKRILFFCLLTVFCGLSAGRAADDDWTLVDDKDQIRVYVRENPDSGLREYRTDALLDEDIMAVSAVLDDVPAAVKWFPFCRFAGLIDELADGRKIIMNVADLPWPFEDRYAVFSSRKKIGKNQKQITIDFEIDEIAKNRDVAAFIDDTNMIKMGFMKGQWSLIAVDDRATRVTYTVCADPGGHIPGWLITTFFDSTPYKTLENLKQFVKATKYQQDRVSRKISGGAESGNPP